MNELAMAPSTFSNLSLWLLQTWNVLGDWPRLILVGAFLGFLLGFSEILRYVFKLPAEATRKTIHMVSGLLACLFPWIFHSQAPILALASGMIVCFIIARYFSLFRSLFGVDRRSWGDIYFIVSVWILFVLTPDNRLFYFIPLLTLTIADALAALLGKTYQKFTYAVEHQFKSFEGSTVFLLATFLCVHIPLLIFSPMSRVETILIPLELAILVTCLESICLNGSDNIIIPLSSYYILKHPLSTPEGALTRIFVLLSVLVFVVFVGKKLRFLSFSGSLVISLVCYSLYALHDYDWLIPGALAICLFGLFYAALESYKKRLQQRPDAVIPFEPGQKAYHVLPTFYIALVPSLIALSQDVCLRLDCPIDSLLIADLYPLFITSVVIELTLAITTLLKRQSPFFFNYRFLTGTVIGLAGTLIFSSLFLPVAFQSWLCLASCLVASQLHSFLTSRYGLPTSFPWPWRAYAISSAAAIVMVWGLYHFI